MTIRLNGSTSGYTEIDAPAVAGSNTLVLPTGAGSAYQVVRNGATAGSLEFTDKIVSGTAVASTSGTSIDFTGIPSWVKQVTVLFNGVSLSGASSLLVQIGSGSVLTSGYSSGSYGTNNSGLFSTAGYVLVVGGSTNFASGSMQITNISGNSWVSNHQVYLPGTTVSVVGGGVGPLSGTLDRVRITTVNGTDTFDAGSINILYE